MATNSPPPYTTPLYENGSLHPAWMMWFNAINEGAAGGEINQDQFVELLAENLPTGALDFAPPPKLKNFAVSDGFNTIFLSWDQPTIASFGYVEVYRSISEIFTFAIPVGTTLVNTFGDTPPASAAEQTYYYWARIVTKAGVKGPFNAVLGTPGKTAPDPAYVLAKLSESLNAVSPTFTGPQLVFETQTFGIRSKDQELVDKYPFIVDAVEGVVMDTALIRSASITDAKIGSVKADKIQAGTISAAVSMTSAHIIGGVIDGGTITGGLIQTTDHRTQIYNDTITVTDGNGVVRVRIGKLS